MENRPKVGVAIIVFKDDKVLLGKRLNAYGDGMYAGPGGHLEFGESFEECAKRECKEEAGIEVENARFLYILNINQHKEKHYVDIGVGVDWKSGEPQNLEPDKREGWGWYDLNDLPEPLFGMLIKYREHINTGQTCFDNVTYV